MTDVANRLPIGNARIRFGSSARDRSDIVRDADVISQEDIDREIGRSSVLRLAFPRLLEMRYEADTKPARARHISVVIATGLVFYLSGTLIDAAMFPDLGRTPVLVRLVMAPLILFALWVLPRAGATFRNGYVSFMVAVVIISPIAFMAVSRGPLAPYTIIIVFLTVIVGTVMLRIQFAWTCLLAAVTAVSIGGHALPQKRLSAHAHGLPLAQHLHHMLLWHDDQQPAGAGGAAQLPRHAARAGAIGTAPSRQEGAVQPDPGGRAHGHRQPPRLRRPAGGPREADGGRRPPLFRCS